MFKKYVSLNTLGFSRSLLAAGMLLTIMFNNIKLLLPQGYLQTNSLSSIGKYVNFFVLLGPEKMIVMQVIAIFLLLITISGYFIQITCFLHFWIAASFYFFRPLNVGGDSINMLLTLLLIPVCLFDERINHWNKPAIPSKLHTNVQTIFLILIKLQVSYIYWDAVIKKLLTPEWRNGTIIYYWFNHNFFGLEASFTKYTTNLLTSLPVLLFIAWITIAVEALIATAVFWSDRNKTGLLKLAIIFHLWIMLVLGFSSFFFAISGGLFLYLYPTQKRFGPLYKNQFTLFYSYIILILIIANLLPVSGTNSMINTLLVLTGLPLLFIRKQGASLNTLHKLLKL